MEIGKKRRYSIFLSTAIASLLLFSPLTDVHAQTDTDTSTEPAVEEVNGTEETTPTADETEESTEEENTEDESSIDEDRSVPEENVEEKPAPNVNFDEKTFYMTEQNNLSVQAYVGNAKAEDFTWTFNGKPIENLRQWNYLTGKFDHKNPLITLKNASVENGVLKADFFFNYPFTDRAFPNGTPKLDYRYDKDNLRLTYSKYIGKYQLVGINKNGQTITQTIHYRPFEHFLDYEELVEKTDGIVEEANKQGKRYVTIKEYGKSTEGRPLRYGIVADSEESVNRYLNEIQPLMLNNPTELIKKIKENPNLDYRIPVFIHNTHADETPGPEVVAGMFENMALKDTIQLLTQNEKGKKYTVTLNVPNILNRLIFLFTFVESPDSRTRNYREHPSTGMDLNRDHGYQVLPEVKAMTKLISDWNPLAFFDMHGFMNPMLIEPTNPPHDVNFEADLLYPHALKQAYAIGHAAQANTGYKFQIPYENWRKYNINPNDPSLKGTEIVGWDDAFSGYTGVFGLYHGIFGHTVEIPETNDRSYIAGVSGMLGAVHYINSNLNELFITKLTIFERGINKVEDPETDKYFVGADNKSKGRPRKDGQKFFPDYYIIPMNVKTQKNTQAAFEMIEYFKRNGVKVNELTQDMGGYHKGDLIINMAQAKRGFANHVLYTGSNESDFPAMYAELIVNFPVMRGFNSYAIHNKDGQDLFANVLGEVTHTEAPRNNPGIAPYYFVKNNGAHVIQAVNEALKSGKKVYIANGGYYMDKATYDELSAKYALIAKGEQSKPNGQAIRPLKIYAQHIVKKNRVYPIYPSNAYNSLKEMGFQLVDTIEEADLLVLDQSVAPEMLGKKPTIILGSGAGLDLSEIIPGLKVTRAHDWKTYEGLMKAHFDQNNPFTSGFDAEDIFYSREAAWIATLPEGFKAIARLQDSNDFYLAGWWPGHEDAQGQAMAMAGNYKGQPVFYYAGTLTNRLHTKSFYRILANAIFSEVGNVAASGLDKVAEKTTTTEQTITTEKAAVKPVVNASALPSTGTEDNSELILASIAFVGTGLAFVYRARKEEIA